MRFVSHLDMTRFMTRMVRRAGIPVWYTEGFHPHLYLTFALPLSLGFESSYEVMDLRLTDDDFPLEEVTAALNRVFPPYVEAFLTAEPVLKTGKIAFADFEISFEDGGELRKPLEAFFTRPEILCEKKTKKGGVKQIDLAQKISHYEWTENEGNTTLILRLPAGGEDNVNPTLLLDAFFAEQEPFVYKITRTALLDKDKNLFQ